MSDTPEIKNPSEITTTETNESALTSTVNSETNLTFDKFSWMDFKNIANLLKVAKALSTSNFIPDSYKGDPASCLLAMELADRLGQPIMTIFQNMYPVNGRPSWSGKFCEIAIMSAKNPDGTQMFGPFEYVWYHDEDGNINGCSVQAKRLADGKLCCGAPITWETVKGFGWEQKKNSMWNIPGQREQMYMYRACEYFVNAFCAHMLSGMYSEQAQKDISGNNDDKTTVKISLGGNN